MTIKKDLTLFDIGVRVKPVKPCKHSPSLHNGQHVQLARGQGVHLVAVDLVPAVPAEGAVDPPVVRVHDVEGGAGRAGEGACVVLAHDAGVLGLCGKNELDQDAMAVSTVFKQVA